MAISGDVAKQSCGLVRLQVEVLRDDVADLYTNHGTFHEGDSGLDLFVVEDQTIKAGESAFLKLGIKATVFKDGRNVSWLIMPRSSICKTPLRQANSIGLIDAGYRGEIMLPVDNIKTIDHTVKRGDRLAQAIAFSGEPLSLEIVAKLDDTARGAGGFGSTGKTSQSITEKTATTAQAGDDANVPHSTADGQSISPATKKFKGSAEEVVAENPSPTCPDENAAPVAV